MIWRMPDKLSPPTRIGYIPTLDGWRAFAVFSVILYHDNLHRFGPFSDSLIHNYGSMGVDLFFAISGILICSRLLDEEYSHHQISLSGFYVRRFCRILPPAWLYLAVLALLGVVDLVHVGFSGWLAALLFVENYYLAHIQSADLSAFTSHFWSLAIEEHFYLILPGILVLFRARRISVLVWLIAAFSAYRLMLHSHPGWFEYMAGKGATQRTELRINALLFPALLAILLRKPDFHRFATRWLKPVIVIPALMAVFAAAYFAAPKPPSPYSSLFVNLTSFGFPFLIVCTMLHPASYVSRFLELAPLRHLGKISYSIYLWQQLFFVREQGSMGVQWPLSLAQNWPWCLVGVLLIANASYYFVERPFMRLGHRLAPPATPGRSDLKVTSPGAAPANSAQPH